MSGMVTRVDAALPVHALTVTDVDAMLEAGILEENSRIELLDGVLVEMSPQGPPHAYALRAAHDAGRAAWRLPQASS